MKHLNVFILLFLINTIAFAQVPSEINGINYQGIAREADGTPIADDLIDIRITILDNSNASIFQETHNDVSTNQFGLFTLIIGSVNSLQSTLWSTATQIITEADFGSGYDEIGTVNLAAVPYAFKAKYEGQEIDFNTNSGYLRISNGTKDANGNPVFIDSTQISISGGGTDDQTITDFELTNSNMLNIEIEDGNTMSVDLSDLIDDSDSDSLNEIQDLTLNSTTNILTITNNNGATNINLSPYLELPNGTINGQVLTWNNGTSTWSPQNAGTGADNWGTQVVNTSGTNISGDGTSGSPLTVIDGDSDAANEIQDISFSGNNLSISSGSTIDLSTLQDGTGTDSQTLSVSGSTLAITNGNSITLPSGTDNQDLSLSGNNLTLTNDGTPVDLSSYLDNTDSQNLTLSGNNLSISGGNSITLPSGTDNQDLSLSGNNLTLTNDGTPVDLSNYLDNTDSQNLALSGNNLSISGGNTVDLSSLKDQDWYEASSTNTPDNINDNIFTNGNVGIGTNNPDSPLDFGNLKLNKGNGNVSIGSDIYMTTQGLISADNHLHFHTDANNDGSGDFYFSKATENLIPGTTKNLMTIKNSGDVGIGVSIPSAKLEIIENSSSSTPTLIIGNTNTTGDVSMFFKSGTSTLNDDYFMGYDASEDAFIITQSSTALSSPTSRNRFVIKDNSGHIGIGNSSPTAKLEVHTNTPSTNPLFIGENASTPHLVVSGNGSVGLGTTSPSRPLDLLTNSPNSYGISHYNSTDNIRMSTYIGNSYTSSNIQGASIGTETDNPFFIYVNNNGEKFYIGNSSQSYNVGIGTDDPNEKLDVEGSIEIDDDYKYETPKIKSIQIPSNAFKSIRPEIYNYRMNTYVGSPIANTYGDAAYGHFVGGSSASVAIATTPIYLPDDAVLSSLEAVLIDTDASRNIQVSLVRVNTGSINPQTMATISSSGSGSGITNNSFLSTSIFSTTTIDNYNNAYYIKIESYQNLSSLAVKKIRLTYTVSKAD